MRFYRKIGENIEMKRNLHNFHKYTEHIKNDHRYSFKSISEKFNDLTAFWLQESI